jgi:hypothetical protein
MKFKAFLFACLCFATLFAYSQKKPIEPSKDDKAIDTIIGQLKGLRFHHDIEYATDGLVNYQQKALPKMISLLYDKSRLNTDPGDPYTVLATGNYSGHFKVGIIPYNFDWLSVRAGYVIETLTFIDFGYSSTYSKKDVGFGSIKITWDKLVTAETLKKDRKMLADKVAAWWKKNSASWSRFNALKTALQSSDKANVARAVDFIQVGGTKCDGFTKETYEKELKPLLQGLLINADKELKRNIESILEYGPSSRLVPRD